MASARAFLIWTAIGLAVVLPLILAASSEYLAWRDPIYVVAGFAGILALCITPLQPLLVRAWPPGLRLPAGRRLHRAMGTLLVAAVVVHVAGLWVTSPPDVIDALLLRSPTPFSLWGVSAMWAVFTAAILAGFRRRLSPKAWRISHMGLVAIVVVGGAVHALLIEGTMEPVSKIALCALAICMALAGFIAPWLRAGRRTTK
ncbi:ferric reductase-like transmembrane domain-containing protein [Rhizobium sp. SSA_523]|uniref:ferric reductase-like transmembrane domain-containing protein n=1 Tax=Rhizobium sp. SSA_523 TaxID=2952477 RepID=UPI00209144F3|nr:ferric reductase-like transmembrane domain-containing protein [Rhizobium sp. SSA_523]MCO5733302.1 ferric reductase-like transmembrane domain-containing protein [Rhizobium sp. SSA_523]WKC21715.1 ferric reductase-like transmembrane domain-containing protein [Rhizobium sp. SSA_523]